MSMSDLSTRNFALRFEQHEARIQGLVLSSLDRRDDAILPVKATQGGDSLGNVLDEMEAIEARTAQVLISSTFFHA